MDVRNSKPVEQIVAAIKALDLEPIKVKLMDPEEGQGWTREYTNQMAIAYKRFLTLLAKYPDAPNAPSKDIDKFWHGHILDTMKYAEDCRNVFGYFLHHFPYFGMRGADDAAALAAASKSMQLTYEREFGETMSGSKVEAKTDAAFCCATAEAAFCCATAEKTDAAFCCANAIEAAFCCATAEKVDAAFCCATAEKTDAAFCCATAAPAFCCATAEKVDAAFCCATVKKIDAAFCCATAAPAFCCATAEKGDASEKSANEAAFCCASAENQVSKPDFQTRPRVAVAA